jgi:hypothetical protein
MLPRKTVRLSFGAGKIERGGALGDKVLPLEEGRFAGPGSRAEKFQGLVVFSLTEPVKLNYTKTLYIILMD